MAEIIRILLETAAVAGFIIVAAMLAAWATGRRPGDDDLC